jgi:hypothetical protein
MEMLMPPRVLPQPAAMTGLPASAWYNFVLPPLLRL